MKKVAGTGVGIVLLVIVFLVVRNTKPDMRKGLEETYTSGARTAQLTQAEPSAVGGSSTDENNAVPSANAYTENNLSDPVKTLLGLDGQEPNYNSLKAAIGKLSQTLPADDVLALRDMLTWLNDRFPEGMRHIEINSVKNDVMDRLLRQNELPEGIGSQLVEMYTNQDNDRVWRDYCIQFMTPFYERVAAESGTTQPSPEATAGKGRSGGSMASSTTDSEAAVPPSEELSAVREAMFAALDERGGTMAGTSLIGLELLSRTHDEFDRKAIVAKTTEIAADESAASTSRMTALRLSASENLKPETGNLNAVVAETARSLAQTGETVLLRSAAIVTLGEIGSAADRELLESYTLAENRQIADAAKLALQKMDARNGPPRSLAGR